MPRAHTPVEKGAGRMTFLERLGDWIWDPWLLGGFLLLGLWCSVGTGFFQLFGWRRWLGATVGALLRPKEREKGGGLTQLQALSTALASTIGTGSIAGVATAIFYGGPGAVFWMWVSALLGMMTGCVEKTLAVRYRCKSRDGGWEGGPMAYMTQGLGLRPLALVFSLFCVTASIGGGDLVQANSIAAALEHAFGWDRLAVGVVTAVLTGAVILGGIGRIGRVSERLVPAMAILFLAGGGAVVLCHAHALPEAFAAIFRGAFAPKAAVGGGLGYSMTAAMRYGVARGGFTNEAGLGSSAMAHAAADVDHPAEEGMWGIFEVFVATGLVCTVTALAILTSGVYDPQAALAALEAGTVENAMVGAALSAAAFSTVLGRWGGPFVAVCLLLFAFSSLLGWSYYGQQGLAFLTGTRRWTGLYRLCFLLFIVVGSVGDVGAVWQVADICNGMMALPNLIALLLLSPEAFRLLRTWAERREERRTIPRKAAAD